MTNAGRLPTDNAKQTAGGLGRRGTEQRREPLAGRGSGAGAVIVAVERSDNKRRKIQTGTVGLANEAAGMREVGTGDEQQCYQAMTVELREKVQQIIESKVNKLQQVTQQNVQSVVKHGTLSTLLRGTQWKASDAVWNWIARRQEEGDSTGFFGAINLLGPRSLRQRPYTKFWSEHFTYTQLRYELLNGATGAPAHGAFAGRPGSGQGGLRR